LKKIFLILFLFLITLNIKAQINVAYAIGVLGGDLSVTNSSNPLTMSLSNCIQVSNGVTKFAATNNESFVNNCIVDLNYNKLSIQIAPNPFVNSIYVTFKDKIDKDDHFKISVFNNIGQLVKVESVNQSLFYSGYKISLSHIPTGIYFMQINSSKVNEVFKIVKNE